MKKHEYLPDILFCAAIFIFVFVFFSVIHPMMIFNTDDWQYISFSREAIPLWKAWNPTRVFPEIFMPFCSSIAAYFIYPLTGDYVGSLTMVFAAVAGLFITVYIFLFGRLLSVKFKQPKYKVLLFSALFFILHFLIFRSKARDNIYLFYPSQVTTFFYYTLPAILNCCLVLYLMQEDVLYDGPEKLRKGIYLRHPMKYSALLLCIYMALLSNLYASIFLVAYVGCQLLSEFITFVRKKENLRNFLIKNSFRFILIGFWIVVQVFEMNGGRASSFSDGSALQQNFAEALENCISRVQSLNKFFIGIAAVSIIAAVISFVTKNREKTPNHGKGLTIAVNIAGAGLISWIYIAVICIISNPYYLSRADVIFPIAFCLIFIIMLCGIYITDNIPQLSILLSVLILIAACDCKSSEQTFSNPATAAQQAVTEDIINQFRQADENGEKEIVLYVPHYDSEDNWPIAINSNSKFSEALYEHGVTKRKIKVLDMVPTDEKNKELGVALP